MTYNAMFSKALLGVIESWTRILDAEGGGVDVIYFDFVKAFDTVPMERLLLKCLPMGSYADMDTLISDRRVSMVNVGQI